jgi:hypothetical protein
MTVPPATDPHAFGGAPPVTAEQTGPASVQEAPFRIDATSTGQRLGAWWRRHKFWLITVTIALVVTLGIYLVSSAGGRSGSPLAIDNPAPSGGQAAATILAGEGVTVTSTDSLAATLTSLSGHPHSASTVFFFDPLGLLTPAQVKELAAKAGAAGAKIVAIAPGPLSVKNLSGQLSSAGVASFTSGTDGAACANPGAEAAGAIDGTSISGLGATGSAPTAYLYRGAITCFPDPSTASGNARGTAGLLATTADGDITVLGNPAVVSNDRLTDAGNAALALRLLGSRPELIWYTASLADLPTATQQSSLSALTPAWILPAGLWLLLVGVLGMLWRGRRYGPLVLEPLPVIVKSAETVTGRARLYQDARAVGTAAAALQSAALARLAVHLRLGTGAGRAEIVAAAAEHSGLPHARLEQLLIAAAPRTDKDLLALARDLQALEEEVTTA